MTINIPQAANHTSLHLETHNKTRRIFMVRSRVDFQGNFHEENRTCFHKNAWLKLSDKKWAQKRDHFIKKFSDTMSQAINETNGNIRKIQL
jgi:hypothetical protein